MYKNKNIAIFGLGKSGIASINKLLQMGANIFAADDNKEQLAKLANNPNLHIAAFKNFPWNKIESLVLSPGVPISHPIRELANKNDVEIICDFEILHSLHPDNKYIGITGTNGKSTTTALINHIAKHAKLEIAAGGNIGTAVCDLPDLTKKGIYLLESSSYQLALLKNMEFDISILLNITPDHIDHHDGIENYIEAKKRIFKANKRQIDIIGIDSAISREIYEEILDENENLTLPSKLHKIIPISTHEIIEGGISVIDGVLYNNIDEMQEQIQLGNLPNLLGNHNAENIAASFAASYFLNIKNSLIIEAIQTFPGLAHRMQNIGKFKNITFINDSKATNAEATEKALLALSDKNIYWIAGGRAKDGGIKNLKYLFDKIDKVFLLGESENDFAETIGNKIITKKCGNLENAFKAAIDDALNEDNDITILLSPAGSSFDQWKSFEDRGNYFCELVKKLQLN